MTRYLFVCFLTFLFASSSSFANEVVSNERISEITERLEQYSQNELIERRDFLISFEDDDEEEDKKGVPVGSASERALEISVIEALLVALGALVLDNVTEDSSTPPDTVFPVLTILGDNPATVELGATYTDAGATSDGGETVTSSGTVDTNTVGTYTITYSASDAAGNTSTATRTVNVVDTTPPEVTLAGAATVTVELGDIYTELGATATDASGAVTVTTSGEVDTDTLGSYILTYTSTDLSGNSATATRTVNVVFTVGSPPITISGDNPLSVEQGATYTEEGATTTATDLSGSITASGTVDVNTIGSYTSTYKA